MESEEQDRDFTSPRAMSPIQAAMVLLGIYVAMSLAVAGLLRLVPTLDAMAATAQHGAVALSAPAAPPADAPEVNDSP